MASHTANVFGPSGQDSSVTKLVHNPDATWSSYILFHYLVRIGVFLRRLRTPKLDAGDLNSPGPQDFSQFLETYQNGKDHYARKHGVHLDWYLPASETEFVESIGKRSCFEWGSTRVLRFQPKGKGVTVKRIVVYLNGGAFVRPASTAHRYFCSVLSHRLDACVYMYPYELAPSGIAASQLPKLTDFYLRISALARKQGLEVIIAGDSAGGGITACMPLSIQKFAPLLLDAAPRSETDLAKLQPDQLILISPLSSCNWTQQIDEEAQRIQPKDWWLDSTFLKEATALWIGTSERQHSALQRVTSSSNDRQIAEEWGQALPMRSDHPVVDPTGSVSSSESFGLLRRANVNVTLVCGTRDILYPFSSLYAQRCEENSVKCRFIEGKGGIHVYPIMGFAFQNQGCDECQDWIVESVLSASRFA